MIDSLFVSSSKWLDMSMIRAEYSRVLTPGLTLRKRGFDACGTDVGEPVSIHLVSLLLTDKTYYPQSRPSSLPKQSVQITCFKCSFSSFTTVCVPFIGNVGLQWVTLLRWVSHVQSVSLIWEEGLSSLSCLPTFTRNFWRNLLPSSWVTPLVCPP